MYKEILKSLAEKALDKITKSKKECVDRIIVNSNEMNIYGAINSLLNEAEDAYIYAENQYEKDKYELYLSKFNPYMAFSTPQKAKLYDVLIEFFGDKKNNSEINTIIGMIESYSNYNAEDE